MSQYAIFLKKSGKIWANGVFYIHRNRFNDIQFEEHISRILLNHPSVKIEYEFLSRL